MNSRQLTKYHVNVLQVLSYHTGILPQLPLEKTKKYSKVWLVNKRVLHLILAKQILNLKHFY